MHCWHHRYCSAHQGSFRCSTHPQKVTREPRIEAWFSGAEIAAACHFTEPPICIPTTNLASATNSHPPPAVLSTLRLTPSRTTQAPGTTALSQSSRLRSSNIRIRQPYTSHSHTILAVLTVGEATHISDRCWWERGFASETWRRIHPSAGLTVDPRGEAYESCAHSQRGAHVRVSLSKSQRMRSRSDGEISVTGS
jgi:hypothetical protein